MSTYLTAMGLILIIMAGWISVQRFARRFAARHPEYGPARECMGCGLGCACEEQPNEPVHRQDKQDEK